MDDHRIGIERVRFSNVSAFLIYTEDSVVLVDTGTGKTPSKINDALSKIGKGTDSIKAVILTHTHHDHAGGVAALRKSAKFDLIVHKFEASNLQRGTADIPDGTRWKGKLIAFTGRLLARRWLRFIPSDPDILVERSLDLSPYGIQGKIIHTPGHTLGSVSVILQNGIAIVGDIMLGIRGKQHFPPFADNRNLVLESWKMLIDSGSSIFYPAHGNEVKVEEIVSELPLAIQKYSHQD